MSSSLIIRTCHHILSSGLRCRGAAVRGRACCRHHLDARTRLHNMPVPDAAPLSSAGTSQTLAAILPATVPNSAAS